MSTDMFPDGFWEYMADREAEIVERVTEHQQRWAGAWGQVLRLAMSKEGGSVTSMWEYDKERRGMDHGYDSEEPALLSGFTTKDSGKRAEFEGGGVRDTQEGKPRFDLLLPVTVPYKHQMLTRFAALMGRGAEKYADRNWEQFSDREAYDRAKASALRHAVQWFTGETDEDHAAATTFNVWAAEYVKGVLLGLWTSLPAPEHRAVLFGIKKLEVAS